MEPKEIISKIQKNGWKLDRVHGSHYILEKDGETVSILNHNQDMKPGLLNDILKKTGLK